eukprot:430128-Rhodomonas_salina.1
MPSNNQRVPGTRRSRAQRGALDKLGKGNSTSAGNRCNGHDIAETRLTWPYDLGQPVRRQLGVGEVLVRRGPFQVDLSPVLRPPHAARQHPRHMTSRWRQHSLSLAARTKTGGDLPLR